MEIREEYICKFSGCTISVYTKEFINWAQNATASQIENYAKKSIFDNHIEEYITGSEEYDWSDEEGESRTPSRFSKVYSENHFFKFDVDMSVQYLIDDAIYAKTKISSMESYYCLREKEELDSLVHYLSDYANPILRDEVVEDLVPENVQKKRRKKACHLLRQRWIKRSTEEEGFFGRLQAVALALKQCEKVINSEARIYRLRELGAPSVILESEALKSMKKREAADSQLRKLLRPAEVKKVAQQIISLLDSHKKVGRVNSPLDRKKRELKLLQDQMATLMDVYNSGRLVAGSAYAGKRK